MRFDYGALPPWCKAQENGRIARIGPDRVTLHAPVPIDMQVHCTQADFVVTEGQRFPFVLSYSISTHPAPPSIDADAALRATQAYWRSWIGRFDESRTKWPSAVKRSLITLRAMADAETGGLIAAPTTSLPEMPGGSMNWDYRYCWLRDSAFTLNAFINAGFGDEATQWRDWLLRALAGSPGKMRIMYRVDGSRHLDEWTVDHLPGYL